ncbi:hypothetical protein ACJJTC_012965 [Scirpophaga incertulas]
MSESTGQDSPKIVVLDGGFSTQLSCHVGATVDGDPLWSARFLQTNPKEVINTHLDFLRAGADAIMTNTYQASIQGFVEHLGVTPEEGLTLIHKAVELAKTARDTYLQECQDNGVHVVTPLIVGSVGPYGACLHDGSEYDGSYASTVKIETIRQWHIPRVKALIESGVDLLAFETIPCFKEAEMLVQMLKEYPNTKAWLSFSCKDKKCLANGENFKESAIKCWKLNSEQLVAIGVNCCSPAIVAKLFDGINKGRENSPIPLITYPNSGEKYNPQIGWIDDDICEGIDTFVQQWLDLGVRYIGGCCRTYGSDISRIKTQRVFGVSNEKNQMDDKIKNLLKENDLLKEENLKLKFDISKLKKNIGKLKDEQFSDYLMLMRERDARYTLYFENLGLQMKLKELDGSSAPLDDAYGDPIVLRIALDRCREQLTATQNEFRKMSDEYADTVPQREFDSVSAKLCDQSKELDAVTAELVALQDSYKRLSSLKEGLEEELSELKERCAELERAGTPRPPWDICADFISGGRDRWWQLAKGLSSRDTLRVLLKELGPAAETEQLEYFEGLGTDPSVPPYLRYSGKVRDLRLSRRELNVVVHDLWQGKLRQPQLTMRDYVTQYFEERYQQPSVRAEWAYSVCAGAAAPAAADEPQVSLFCLALRPQIGRLAESAYAGLRRDWYALRDALYATRKEAVTIEEFEKIAKSVYPLKSEVDIKNLIDVVRKQLKLKLNNNEINLDKLFLERRAARLRLLREVAARVRVRVAPAVPGAPGAADAVSVEALKRAFALADPAIDHVRMERYLRWAFGAEEDPLDSLAPQPLATLLSRLAVADVTRAGPQSHTRVRARR